MVKKKNHAGQVLRTAVAGMTNSKSLMGDHYRKMRSRLGGKGAVVATAHKVARIIYAMLKERKEYNIEIPIKAAEKDRHQQIKRLQKRIAKLQSMTTN